MSNVRADLRLHGYTNAEHGMPDLDTDQVYLLRKCLIVGSILRKNRNALRIDEEARPVRYAGPGECLPCHLHAQNREGEKLLKEMLLAGMRRLLTGELVGYVHQVETIVNTEILSRSTMHHGEDGQWTFPIDHEQHKLKEINLTKGSLGF